MDSWNFVEKKTKALEMTIEELELSVHSFNCLKGVYKCVEELTQRTEEDMMKVRNWARNPGRSQGKLAELGLSLVATNRNDRTDRGFCLKPIDNSK